VDGPGLPQAQDRTVHRAAEPSRSKRSSTASRRPSSPSACIPSRQNVSVRLSIARQQSSKLPQRSNSEELVLLRGEPRGPRRPLGSPNGQWVDCKSKVCDLRPNLRGPQASPRENRIRASHTRLKNGSRKLGHVDFDVVRDSAEDHVVGRHGPEDRTRHELGMKPRCRPRSTTAACAPRAAQEGCGAAAACRAASS
jgi:hypothetical protein